MIDLHVHTTASDGQYSPTQIIQKAHEKHLTIMAITDHDTIDGLEEGKKAAKDVGIRFVPGVELNINFPTGEFHLLGLGLKNPSDSLKNLLSELVKNRDFRNNQIIEKMQSEGVDITLDELYTDFPDTVIGRPHFAAELVKKKIVKTRQQAFDIYLAKGRKWYVERVGSNLDEAIVAIKDSGGVPVVAHPMSLYLSWGKLPDVMKDFYNRGVMGLEAFHPGARVSECLRLEELAHKIGYFVTGGSDFHGEQIRTDRRLGHTCGGKKIEASLFNPLESIIYTC
ncbi:MAG: PHP domain-containing protein [Treponema sp.]|nr:PHP domain-containing protein [Treponema sp.]MCI5665197.1 PHP domain-containing protein [Spirochaetia bacterium]MDD7768650.1 PHP domain-containing protein [Treponema sp.]MDY3131903.1 PHP domain-containing protein [Treponema sp.]